jgi:hypothetical protein
MIPCSVAGRLAPIESQMRKTLRQSWSRGVFLFAKALRLAPVDGVVPLLVFPDVEAPLILVDRDTHDSALELGDHTVRFTER